MRAPAIAALLCAAAGVAGSAPDPFATAARVRVLIFARTDCPITNRYAPELQRLSREFAGRGVEFWLVYPDPAETLQHAEDHIAQYGFPGGPLLDPHHDLVKRARASVAPEAAVFDAAGRLEYHGRIDDRWIDAGKAGPAARTHDLEEAISAVLAGKPVQRPQTRAVGCFLADVE